MLKLILPDERYKWSYLNGYNVFNFDVELLRKNDIYKYDLIDENSNKIDIKKENYLLEYE